MAQVTALSPNGVMGKPYSFSAKEAAPVVNLFFLERYGNSLILR